jgi:hypothetical protein
MIIKKAEILQSKLREISQILDLEIIIPHLVNLDQNCSMYADALVPQIGFGCPNGLLIFTKGVTSEFDKLNKLGYTWSLELSVDESSEIHLLSQIEFFSDFGWNDIRVKAPEWMIPYDEMDQYLDDRERYFSLYLETRWKHFKDLIRLDDW